MKFSPHPWRDLPLASKVAIFTSILVTAAVFALTILFIQRERDSFHTELLEQADVLLNTIPRTMRDQIYRMELDELQDIAEVVVGDNDITLFVVYDPKGAVLVDASLAAPPFTQTVDPLGARLVAVSPDELFLEWQETQLLAGRSIYLGNQVIGAVSLGLSTNLLDQKIASLTAQSLFLALLTLAVGAGLAFIFARQITHPLSELAGVASDMAKGNLTNRVTWLSRDEVGRVGQAFNLMADAIEKRQNELHVFAASLEQTVAERTQELRNQNEILEQMAIADPLTGSFNRRHFFDLAQRTFEESQQRRRPVAVLIMDADNFKQINDTYGHQVGDQMLIHVVEICKKNIRGGDIFGRYGGEEFILMMDNSDCDAAEIVAERLRDRVASTPLMVNKQPVDMSFSAGLACWDGLQDMTLDALLGHADVALYQSKAAGRNRVTIWKSTVGVQES